MQDAAGNTQLLHDWRGGDDSARDVLFDRVYDELRMISASLLRSEGAASLSTGDLVSEASMRLLKIEEIEWQDKAHFMAMAARMMRRVLVEHARAKGRNKRKHRDITLTTNLGPHGKDILDLLHVEQALTRLKILDKERADIIELRYYGGLSFEETAEALGISVSTAKRKWRSARAWLLITIENESKLQ